MEYHQGSSISFLGAMPVERMFHYLDWKSAYGAGMEDENVARYFGKMIFVKWRWRGRLQARKKLSQHIRGKYLV